MDFQVVSTETARSMIAEIGSDFRVCADRRVAAPRLTAIHDGFDVNEIVQAARSIFDGNVSRVSFIGKSGCGKTTGAALLIGELAKLVSMHYARHCDGPAGRYLAWYLRSLVWVESNDLSLQADVGNTELAHAAEGSKILVLDDLGNEKCKFPASANVGASILQTRHSDSGKVSIVTTFMTGAEIEAKWGSGLRRRIGDRRDPRCKVILTKAAKESALASQSKSN